MTLVGVNVRRTLQLLLAVVLLFGATTVIASQSAHAAFPGSSDWIVFENDSDGDFDLYVTPVDGGTPTKISDSLFWQVDPVFSPDGTKVAFASNHEGTSSIYVSGFDPSGPSMDAQAAWVRVTSGGSDGEPTWAPDGLTLAFQRRFDFNVSGTADATHATVLTDATATFGASGVLAGQTVSNTTAATAGVIVSVGSATQVTTDIAWTAGDEYIISVSHRQIMTAAADGTDSGAETQLGGQGATPSYSDYQPSWDPDGALIAFTTTRNGNADIYVFTTAGASPTNLTDNTATSIDAWATRPSWSPDGDFVAFQTKEPDTAVENIWKVNRAGTTATAVTSGVADEVAPAWSPDGTEIAYQDTASGAIYVVAAGGGTGTAVTTANTPAGTHAAPDWRPTLAGVDDADSVDEHGSVIVDVLDNDLVMNAAGGSVATSATLVTAPTLGTATRNVDNTFTYEHTGPEIGTSAVVDTFEYTVTQGTASSTAVVTITINPVDDDPVAVADEYDVSHGQTLTVSVVAEGVLGNDSDPEGGGLSATLVDDVSHGTLSLAADGTFTYTNDGLSSAAIVDSFTYTASDGPNDSAVTTAEINVGAENPDPPSAKIVGPSFGGPGVEASFSVDITDGSGPKVYAWTITHNSSVVASGATAAIEYTPAVTGAHTVQVTVTDDAGADTESVTFTVMTDIAGTFVNDIVWLANEGVTKGCNPPVNDTFCTNDFVTRGQMAAFLVRFLGLTDDGGGDLFEDDDGTLFEANIDKLATAGITKGCNPADGNTNFCPNDFVTRGQMAAFLVRALTLTDDGGGDLFEDDNGSIFEASIDKLATAGITKGCNPGQGNTNFCPDDLVTRGQMAAFLRRADALK